MKLDDTAAYEAWDKGDLKRAFVLFKALAGAGDESAQINLGYFYDLGLGTRKNKTKALQWYHRAHRMGAQAAAGNIATIHRDKGRIKKALSWYLRAAQRDDGDAMVVAATYMIAGSGTHRNVPAARRLLKKALASKYITSGGRESARLWLASVAQQGVPGDVAASRRRA